MSSSVPASHTPSPAHITNVVGHAGHQAYSRCIPLCSSKAPTLPDAGHHAPRSLLRRPCERLSEVVDVLTSQAQRDRVSAPRRPWQSVQRRDSAQCPSTASTSDRPSGLSRGERHHPMSFYIDRCFNPLQQRATSPQLHQAQHVFCSLRMQALRFCGDAST